MKIKIFCTNGVEYVLIIMQKCIGKRIKKLIKKKQNDWYKRKGGKWKKKYDKKHLARSRERDRKRYHSDPQFRTKKNITNQT